MDKEEIKKRQMKILDLIKSFTDEKLDTEYFELSKNLLMKLARKRDVPFTRGRLDIWAGSIIYAIGSINFLFDKSFEPYVSSSEIAEYFNAGQSTILSKAKTIKELTKIELFDPKFSTEHVQENNPWNNLTMTDNGFIIPKSAANNREFTNESSSFLQRIVRDCDVDEEMAIEFMKNTLKDNPNDECNEDELNSIIGIINRPMTDDEFYNLIGDSNFNNFDDDKFDDDFDDDRFDSDHDFDNDEFDFFNNMFEYLMNESDSEYEDQLSALSYDAHFLEVCEKLIDLFLMRLSELKHGYLKNKPEEVLEDFDFNNDILIIFTEKYDKASHDFNKFTKGFNKFIKKYKKDKNRFFNIKVELDKVILREDDIEGIKNEVIPAFEEYMTGIYKIKEFVKIMNVNHDIDSYNDFKNVFKIIADELSVMEKYNKEFINKLKNIKRS
jgi:hypothetical protein